MAGSLPDGLTVERNRDLRGRARHPLYRRGLLCLIAVFPVLALLNVFGQHPTVTTAHAAAADLKVTAPARSVAPNPTDQTSSNGRVAFTYNKLAAGHTLVVWLYFQVNPTNVGKRSEDVALNDGSSPITSVHRSLTIFP
jgi:hypothetical protein